jgi:NAD(P)-dependent dehydrogenase (short-subunit alcohol dehydrogenase family)
VLVLQGKVAVVTGAAQGIGRAIVHEFAAAGASVAMCDLNLDGLELLRTELPSATPEHLAYRLDVGDEDAVNAVVGEIAERLGHIDILVNNAGIFKRGWLLELTESEWDETMRVNAKGPFLMTKAVVKHLIAQQQGGKIINIGSISGQIVQAGKVHYAVSKAALIHFSRVMAVELGPHGIQVNVISPGPTVTPQIAPVDPQDYLSRHYIPLGKMAQPEDHAEAALFLASAASNHITGQVLNVDGGEFVTRKRPEARFPISY